MANRGSPSSPLDSFQARIDSVIYDDIYVKAGGEVYLSEFETFEITGYSPNDGSFSITQNYHRIRGNPKGGVDYTISVIDGDGQVYIGDIDVHGINVSNPEPEPEPEPEHPDVIPVKSIELSCSRTTIEQYEHLVITAKVNPSNATDKSIEWISNSGNLLLNKTNTSCELSASSAEDTVVTAKSVSTPSIQNSITISITEYPLFETYTLQPDKTTIRSNGEEVHIKVIYSPPGSKFYHGQSMGWTWDPDYLQLVSKSNDECVLKGIRESKGQTWVYAKANASTTKSAKIVVENSVAKPVKSISFFMPQKKVVVGDTISFSIVVDPGDADDNQILWSSPTGFMHLEDLHAKYPTSGSFRAKSVGTETIVATSRSNPKATASTEVSIIPYIPPSEPIAEISISGPAKLVVGTNAEYRALSLPENAENRKVSNWWIESGSDKITLTSPTGTETGGYCVIIGIKAGPAEIGAGNPNGVFAKYKLDVVEKAKPEVTGPEKIHYSQLDSEHYWEYDASGFSNPDAMNWTSSDISELDFIEANGPHAKFESLVNSNYVADIIATSGSETARFTVQNKRTVIQLKYWNTGKFNIFTSETHVYTAFKMDPVDPSPEFAVFSKISGAKNCKVEYNTSNTSNGAVVFTITGLTPGVDTITVSNGLVSGNFEVTVADKPKVESIEISGPGKVCSVEPADDSIEYTAITAPDVNASVYWETSDEINLVDGIGGSIHRQASCEFRPQLVEGQPNGSFLINAYYEKESRKPFASKKVSVVQAIISKIEIVGPEEVEDKEETLYTVKFTLSGGSTYKLIKSWAINGDGVISIRKGETAQVLEVTNEQVYVIPDLKDESSGNFTITVSVEGYSAKKTVQIIPKITSIVIKGVRYLDKGNKCEFSTVVGPDNASKLPLKWEVTAGSEFVELYSNDTALLSHKATVLGVAPGEVKIRASNVKGTTWVERLLTVNGAVYGSVDKPLDGVNGSLLTFIGDTIYLRSGSGVFLKSQIDDFADCHADGVPGGFGLRLSSSKGVEGNLSKPGILEILTQYSSEDSETSMHKIKIYSVAPEGVDGINVIGVETLSVGQTVRWTATVVPADSAYKEVQFSSEGSAVRILEQGHNVAEGRSFCIIEGLSLGTAQIIARSSDMHAEVTRAITVTDSAPMDEPTSTDETVCCIDVFKKGTSPVRLVMPHVQSISETDSASLTEISTMVFGADNRFIMDLGTTKSYSVSFVRSNPAYYDDGSADPADWSNGRWYEYLIALLDFWQNFGQTANNDNTAYERTGGFKFHFIPPKQASDLYPEIHKTVFLTGAISPSIAVGKLAFRMTLQVARMTGKTKGVSTVKLTYNSNTILFNESYSSDVPKGIALPIGMPPQSWIDSAAGVGFSHWETEDGKKFVPGTFETWDAPAVLLAQWKRPLEFVVFDTAGKYSYKVVDERISTIDIFMIGAGGGSGRGDRRTESGGGPTFERAGGAGAGGEYIGGISVGVSFGDEINIKVGAGGKGGNGEGIINKHEDGWNGENTEVISESLGLNYVARGGDGGDRYSSGSKGAAGGKNYFSGGDGAIGAGAGNPGQIKDFGGSAGPSFKEGTGVSMISSAGGSGGGSCDFQMYQMELADGTLTPNLKSEGGNGGFRTNKSSITPPGNGRYGGGAGSAPAKDGVSGADGLVVIIAY